MVTKNPRQNLMAVPLPNNAPHIKGVGRNVPKMDHIPGVDWTETLQDGPQRRQAEFNRHAELVRIPGTFQAQTEESYNGLGGAYGVHKMHQGASVKHPLF